MARQPFTFPCPLPGYEAMELTINVAMNQEQYNIARAKGRIAPALLDIPNWDEVAAACGLCATDPESGELTADALPKPTFPLMEAALVPWPWDFVGYLASDDMAGDGLKSYREHTRPNSSRR